MGGQHCSRKGVLNLVITGQIHHIFVLFDQVDHGGRPWGYHARHPLILLSSLTSLLNYTHRSSGDVYG